MSELRIAVIGSFGHIPNVLNDIGATEGAAVVALAAALSDDDPSALRGHRVVGEAPKAYQDYREMLAKEKPDVVVVGTRLDRCATVAMDAARAGAHLICEKPLAIDHESLGALWDAVSDAGVECMAMLNMRAKPAFAKAREIVMSGAIGKVVLANARKSYKWGASRPDWFGRREFYGDTIGWVGIHAFDMFNYVTGCGFRAVAAMESNAAHPERPDCQDNCALMVGLDNGAHATVSVDYLRPTAAPTHGDDWVRVVGDKGIVEANASRATCEIIDADGRCEVDLPAEGPMVYKPFLENLRGGSADLVAGARESFMLTQACLCARDAADSGKIVDIAPGRWM